MLADTPRELKLGILLVATAALIVAGSSTGFAAQLFFERFDSTRMEFSIAFALRGLGSLGIIGTAIWVDRHGPRSVMVLGAATLLLIPAHHISVIGAAMFLHGVGGAGVASLFTIAAGILLYRYLPRPIPRSEPELAFHSPAKLTDQPGFWKTAILLSLLFIVTFAIGNAAISFLPVILSPHFDNFQQTSYPLFSLRVATGLGALVWGIASDRFPTMRLLVVAALLTAPVSGIAWFVDAPAVSIPAHVLSAVVRGAFVVLPWIVLAEHFPVRHFAVLGLAFTATGSILGTFAGPLLAGLTMDHWGLEGPAFVLIALSLLAAPLARRFPNPP
ncbi:MAG: MFS transporter, partial [Chloroflexi bacterium]|nr:MFS transporter [Chloroflexota bacterium]